MTGRSYRAVIFTERLTVNLEHCRVVLLLVSPDFIASDYCYARGDVTGNVNA